MRAALYELGDVLWTLLMGMEPWVLVLVCLFCGAWMVQFLDRLVQVPLFGWLRLLASSVAVGLERLVRIFLAVESGSSRGISFATTISSRASRYEWEHRDGWGKKDRQADAFYVYLLELDGGKNLYAGQTRNLMRRVCEHCDGTTKTTAGRNRCWRGSSRCRPVRRRSRRKQT